MQSNVWLGDMVDEVVKVTLHAGNTMIIPTGWIHAVVSTSTAVISKTIKIGFSFSTPQ